MHLAVNNCGHILVKTASHPTQRMAQKFFAIASWFLKTDWSFFFLFFFLNISLIGCSTTSRLTSTHRSAVIDTLAQEEADTLDSENEAESDDEIDTDESTVDQTESVDIPTPISPSLEINPAINRHKVLTDIMGLMGTRYRRSGSDSNGFDCSGFSSKIFTNVLGITLPRSCREQYKTGIPIVRDSLKFGDLIFFKTKKKRPSHVGIYVGDGLFAHASLSLGVTISLIENKYYRKRYIGARRIVQ